MNRLDDLESALWEAHATETRAAAQLETLALQVRLLYYFGHYSNS